MKWFRTKVATVWTMVILLPALMQGRPKPQWQTGLLLDERTASTYLGSLGNSSSSAQASATRFGNTTVAQVNQTGTASLIPIYRTDQALVIDSAPYRYIVSRRVFFKQPTLTINGGITFAVDGNIVYLLDESGKQFKTRLLRKILEPPPPVVVASASITSLFPASVDSSRQKWASTSGPDRYAVRIDGDFVYADQLISGSRWLKIEAQRSGSLYVGQAHVGVADISGKTCVVDEQIEFTLVTATRIEGAMLAYPLDAQLNFSNCNYTKAKEIRKFVWVPE